MISLNGNNNAQNSYFTFEKPVSMCCLLKNVFKLSSIYILYYLTATSIVNVPLPKKVFLVTATY